MIQFSQVSKRYPNGYEALCDVSFSMDKGEMAFVVGASGAGKSTLLKLISLIERPSKGHLMVDGINLSKLSQRKIPQFRRDVGVIFQDHKLLFDRNVFDNVALPLIVSGLNHIDIAKRVRAALGKVGLHGKENAMPITLSGGEQQRVGIARAVINRPSILLADEPTGNLDEQLSNDIMDLFDDFNRVGVTVLIVTHDSRQVARLDKRVLHLDQGQLVASAPNHAFDDEHLEESANDSAPSSQQDDNLDLFRDTGFKFEDEDFQS
jgi:cell division transport system ATP-binding protein